MERRRQRRSSTICRAPPATSVEPLAERLARWLGLDLGGTNIKAAVISVDASGSVDVLGCDERPAGAEHGPPTVLANLAAAGAEAIARWGPVGGAAVGVPGLFHDETGTIEFLPNLPGAWQGEPVTDPLATALGVPVSIINDARAFTLAESRVGAAAGYPTVAALVIGTGIGGGIVVDGALHFGRMGRAGELSHQVIVPDGPAVRVRQSRLPRGARISRSDRPPGRHGHLRRGVRRCCAWRRTGGAGDRRGRRLPR